MTFDEAEKLAFEKAVTLCKYPESGAGVLLALQDGDKVNISVRWWFGMDRQLKQLQQSVTTNSFNDFAPSTFHVVSVEGWNDAEYDYDAGGAPRLCWEGYWDEQVAASFPYTAAEIAIEADQRIAELQAELRAWEETAEHYCKADTPISPDGVRGYIAELEAQLNKLANRARVFLSEIENGQGCMCAATALDITPHCDFCDKSMTLSNALPAEDPADF